MNTFGDIKTGDIFTIEMEIINTTLDEDYSQDVKFIKIDPVVDTDGDTGNAICIDEYFDDKGLLYTFDDDHLISHVNWS